MFYIKNAIFSLKILNYCYKIKENTVNNCDFLTSQFLLVAVIVIARSGRRKENLAMLLPTKYWHEVTRKLASCWLCHEGNTAYTAPRVFCPFQKGQQ